MQITYDTRTQNTQTYFTIIKSDINCSSEIDGKWLNRFHYTSTHQQNSVPRTILYCHLVDSLETNRSHNTFRTNFHITHVQRAEPQVRWSVITSSRWRPKSNPAAGHVGFVVDKVAVGQVFLQTLHISTINYKSTNVPHSSFIVHHMGMGKGPKRLQFNRNTFSPTKREIKKNSKTLLKKQNK